MIKILGFFDLLAAAAFILLLVGIIPILWFVPLAAYLLVKSLVFLIGKDIASAVDLAVSLYFFAFIFLSFSVFVLSLASLLWLLQKAFISFSA